MLFRTLILTLLFNFSFLSATEEMTSEEKEYQSWAKEIWDSLDRQTGVISIPAANATLNVPEDFYYLSPKDAEKVLVTVWGNPPGQNTQGMLFPADSTPFDQNSWGVTIQYQEDGYVSDEDAEEIDYSELLEQMQDETRQASTERVKQGYETIELVGWAATPYYDKVSRKLHWAKEIKFGNEDSGINTLNYNIRVLGRKGVLIINFIAGMDQKEMIESRLDNVLAIADFDDGSKYSDFNPDIDKVAAYGLGALVAGKLIAKSGILVMLLVFLKKFGIIFAVALGSFFKKIFSRNK